jgi:hypothetical protein
MCAVAIAAFLFPSGVTAQVNVFTSNNGGFESSTNTFAANGWTEVNAGNSKWYVGNAAVASGNYGAYIDKNATAGSVNTYNNNNALVSHFYRDFTIPAGAVANLTFKWRCDGEAADNLRVYVIPNTTSVVANAAPSSGLVGGAYYGQGTSFQTENILLSNVAGFTRRLVFTWTQNANNTGNNPPAAVDDVQITYSFPCTGTPTAGTISAGTSTFCGSGSTTLTLGGSTVAADITKQWQYYNGSTWVNAGTNALTYSTGTISGTTQFRVISTCTASGLSSTASLFTVTINPNPVVNVAPADTFICTTGGSMTLTASGTSTSYSWSPATDLNTTTGSTVITTPTTGKAYTVTGTLGSCTSSAIAVVSLGSGPTITASATPSTICSGSGTQLATDAFPTGYEVYSIAPYVLTPDNDVLALGFPSAPPTNNNYDDGRTAAIPLPFTFSFFGNAQTQMFFGTNGVVGFTQNNLVDYFQQNLPDNNTPNNLIALFWHDLDMSATGTVTYGTVGVTPNRKFVITYTGVPDLADASSNNTGQVILHETTNYIDVIIQSSTYSDYKTLGIEDQTGTTGITPSGTNDAIWTVSSASEGYRFAMPTYTYNWAPGTGLSATNIYNPSGTNLTTTTTYTVSVANSVTSCVSTANATVTVNPLPTATITAGTSPVCDGQTSTVAFTGTPNATVVYTINGGSPLNASLDGSGNAVVTTANLSSAVTYGLVSATSSQNCSAPLTGSATINVNIRPTATIGGSTTICNGATANPMVNIGQGTPPWTITYTDGSNTYTQTSSFTSFALNVTPTATTTYTLTGLVDANCNALSSDISGSAVVTVNPRPTASLSTAIPAICEGSSTNLVVSLTGNPPYNFDIYDGTSYTSYTNIMTNSYSIVVNPSVPTTYSVTSLTDANCIGQGSDLGNTVTLNFNVRPTANLTGNNTICNGDATTLTMAFTGSAPWTVNYTDGTNNYNVPGITANPYTFNITPGATATYSLSSVNDANCSSISADMTGSATVVVNYPPAIISQPSSINGCAGDFAAFTVNATGTGLSYQWSENGSPLANGGVYSGVNSPALNISNTAGLNGNTYAVVISGTCPPVITSNTATLSVSGANNWTGAVSSLWSDAANWGCGILPTQYTDAIIPASAPNMPVVDISTAICKDLLINSGASVSFTGTGNVLELKGDVVNLGSFTASNGRVILSGSGNQAVPGVIYRDLEIQGGSNKNFNGNAVVTGMLNLISGYILLGPNNLTLGQNAIVFNSSPSSFVVTNGLGVVVGDNMGAGANTNTVLFPVGSSTFSYTPVSVANAGTADDINVRVLDGVWDRYNMDIPSGIQQTDNAVSKTWLIHETIPGGSNATITPQWNLGDELATFDHNNCLVSHYNTTTNEWEPGPMAAANGFGPYTRSVSGITSFSPFGVASDNSPLPLSLLSFKGELFNNDVRLHWATAYELNMSSFDIERSVNKGKNFIKIGEQKVTGNNKVGNNNYTYTDGNVRSLGSEKLLYRLKMKELDNKFTYSDIIAININSRVSGGITDVYPNPVTGNSLFVRMPEDDRKTLTISVTDVSGTVISATSYTGGSYNYRAIPVDVSNLPQGIYFLRIVNADNNTLEVLKFNRQ